jgi:hypothetical protein
MAYWDAPSASDDWFTPKYIFDAMGCRFDLDVACPENGPLHTPCVEYLTKEDDGLTTDWEGFCYCNPPFGGRNGLTPWLDKFFAHGNGVALTPDRTSAPWWQDAARKADAVLFIAGKVKFIRPDGSLGKSPSNGTTLLASGSRGVAALVNAEAAGLGWLATAHRLSVL